MRILSVGNMYPPHHLGGYELVWQSATAHLRRAGHDVRVLTTSHREDGVEDGADEEVFRELGWYWRDHEFPRRGLLARARLERRNQAILRRHLGEFEPDLLAWWAMGGMSMALIETVRRAGIPAVGFVHDEWLIYGPMVDQWQRAVRRAGVAGSRVASVLGLGAPDLGRAATWVFVSETTKAHALRALPGLERAAVASSGIDLEAFPIAPMKPWDWRLLCVGRLDGRKGTHLALDALAELPETASLAIVGAGDRAYERSLRDRTETLGLGGRVTFSRLDRDELARAYAAADAVLFPVQWEEPWGLVPLEAMACGTPVVASGVGGSGEFLRDGENCLIYRPRDDAAALAAKVRELAAGEGLRNRLRESGRTTAVAHTESRFNEAVAVHVEAAVR